MACLVMLVVVARMGLGAATTPLHDQHETENSVSSCLLQSQKRLAPELAATETHEGEIAGESLTQRRSTSQEAVAKSGPTTFRNCLLPDTPTLHNLTFADYEDHQNSFQGLFVYPPKKFAFCLIEKNACSTWIRKVLQPLLYSNDSSCLEGSHGCQDGKDYIISQRSQKMFGTRGIENIFQDPGATRAVFVREPMERFASAFINKCIDERVHDKGDNCPVKSKVFRDVVEWALQSDMRHVEGHWLPQAFHCELDKRIKGYNAVGLMDRETFTHDMNCLLARVGLDNLINDTQPNLLPSNRSSNFTTVLQKLFTPEAARKFIEKVPYDYDVFGFPKEPEWIAGATGEWYEKEPSPGHSAIQSRTSLRRDNESWADDEIDDLVELAFRAGYGS